MATPAPAPAPSRNPGPNGNGYDPSKLDEILNRFPDLITTAERELPPGPRYELIARRVAAFTNRNRAKAVLTAAATAAAATRGGASAGQPQPLQPPQNAQMQQSQQLHQQQQQQQLQQQRMQQNGTPVQQQQQQQISAQGGQNIQGMQGIPMENSQLFQQQQLYQQQQQGHAQNQQQQQQQMKNLMEAQQRMRQAQQQVPTQQNPGQNQNQNQLQAISALPPSMTAPSPQTQQQQLMGSPNVGQRNGRSPSQGAGSTAGQQMRVPTPVQVNAQLPMQIPGPGPGQQGQMQQQQQQASQQQMGNAKVIIDNFPMLWDMKRKGKLGPDHEKLFNQLLESREGRAHLEQFHAQNASTLVNQLGQIQAGQQQPMTHAQMSLAAQQQLAPLQQQQQAMHAQQLQIAAAQGQQYVNAQNAANGNVNGQAFSQQQQFQLQAMAQRAQAQQNLGSVANQQQQHHLAVQAQALARSQVAQHQMMATHQAIQAQQAQQAQVQALRDQQMQHGDPNAYTGSPRPGSSGAIPAQPQGQAQGAQGTAQMQAQKVRMMFQRVSAMNEVERETFFAGKPELRPLFYSLISNPTQLANLQNMSNNPPQQQQQQQQQQGTNGPGTPGNIGSPALAANGNGGQFGPNGQSRVSANLHIPANKQRNLLPNQNAGTPSAQGSPARIQPTPQQAAIRQMINSGIPVQNGNVGNGVARPGSVGMGQTQAFNHNLQSQMQQMDPKTIKPEMIISQIDPSMPRQRAPSVPARRDSDMPTNAGNYGMLSGDKSESLLAHAKWVPDTAYDLALREKLWEPHAPVKTTGRATLMQGFAQGRVMSDVSLERVPDAIRAIADQADKDSLAQRKKEVDPALPSRKKRKIQDVAEAVDRGLIINAEVEYLLLKLADEHLDTICQVACNLAKHRKSDTLDRKDLQLAYENILGRSFPGFSSDQIRMDQSKPTKRQPVNAARVNKLRLLNDAKAAWRRDKAQERAILGEGQSIEGGGAVVSAA